MILIGPGNSLPKEQQNSDQDKSHYTDRNERQTAPQLALFTLKREKPHETNWAKPNCKQPQNHDEADLCQQIEMSHIADNAFRVGVAQAILAGLTVAGLVITVIYAIKAANAAAASAAHGRTAARAAVRAAQAAQRQFELAERTVSDLERPYIFVYPSSAKSHRPAKMDIEFSIHNSGRLPAVVYELHAEAGIAVCRADDLKYSKTLIAHSTR
jgi:hypothetical protein